MHETTDTPDIQGKPSPVLIVFLIIPLLGIIAAVGVALANRTADNVIPTPLPVTPPVDTMIEKPAPNFELTGLDGKAYRLSSYRGRVVFVNFWATWCEPCKRELPAFEQFTQTQAQNGAAILAVNVAEPVDTIVTYFKENNIGDLLVLLDNDLTVYEGYAVDRLPTTFVIDPTGVVRYKHYGEMTPEDLAAYVSELSA